MPYMIPYSYDRRSKVAKGLRTRVDVRIEGWQGKQTVPPKQLLAFSKDLKAAIPEVGFEPRRQSVQLDRKDLSKLEVVLKKHDLRIGRTPQKATYSMRDVLPPKGKVRHVVPPSRKNW